MTLFIPHLSMSFDDANAYRCRLCPFIPTWENGFFLSIWRGWTVRLREAQTRFSVRSERTLPYERLSQVTSPKLNIDSHFAQHSAIVLHRGRRTGQLPPSRDRIIAIFLAHSLRQAVRTNILSRPCSFLNLISLTESKWIPTVILSWLWLRPELSNDEWILIKTST